MTTIQLRPYHDAHQVEVLRCFIEGKAADFQLLGLPLKNLHELLSSQYHVREKVYSERYNNYRILLIYQCEQFCGVLRLGRVGDAERIIDIAILPDCQSLGIGTQVMQQLQSVASQASRSLDLHVNKDNRALAFYQRLGFAIVGETELQYHMLWSVQNCN